MSDISEIEKQPYIQRGALQLILFVFLVSLFAYVANFSWPFKEVKGVLSGSTGTWGEFGDYLGGVVNPMVGVITIWLLTVSLKQSQQEMALTRKALQYAEASQKATEAALREQIEVTQQARDVNNAVALFELLDAKFIGLEKDIRATRTTPNAAAEIAELKATQEEVDKRRASLSVILENEVNRLSRAHQHNPDFQA
jgi:hypothetical protein